MDRYCHSLSLDATIVATFYDGYDCSIKNKALIVALKHYMIAALKTKNRTTKADIRQCSYFVEMKSLRQSDFEIEITYHPDVRGQRLFSVRLVSQTVSFTVSFTPLVSQTLNMYN